VKEMSDQTRSIVFIVLVIAVTFIWMHYFQPPVPPQKPAPATSAVQTAPAQGTSSKASTQTANKTAVPAAPTHPVITKPVEAKGEANLVVDSVLYHIELSNRGGVVRSWKLKKYLDEETPPRPLDLVDPNAAQELGWPFSLVLADKQLES
jgi:YidC/Oxa1 family membrane protein insertase